MVPNCRKTTAQDKTTNPDPARLRSEPHERLPQYKTPVQPFYRSSRQTSPGACRAQPSTTSTSPGGGDGTRDLWSKAGARPRRSEEQKGGKRRAGAARGCGSDSARRLWGGGRVEGRSPPARGKLRGAAASPHLGALCLGEKDPRGDTDLPGHAGVAVGSFFEGNTAYRSQTTSVTNYKPHLSLGQTGLIKKLSRMRLIFSENRFTCLFFPI